MFQPQGENEHREQGGAEPAAASGGEMPGLPVTGAHPSLRDWYGRQFRYLRLSVTDACNYRCLYCLPNGYVRPAGQEEPLAPLEIERLVTAFAGLGVSKCRLTGGEPTLRRDIVEVAGRVASVQGVQRLALSTNGYRLRQLAGPLLDAGVRGLNVSVNSLVRERYQQITGHDRLQSVLEGIDRALELGFPAVKINVVLLRGLNDGEVGAFFDWARRAPVCVRFIELMPTTKNQAMQPLRLPSDRVAELLVREGWLRRSRQSDDGPAIEFTHADAMGSIGYIAPYDRSFCSGCNRLRVTSQGLLRLCLFGEAGCSLRHLLQADNQQEMLRAQIARLLGRKPESHRLATGVIGDTPSFSVMGG